MRAGKLVLLAFLLASCSKPKPGKPGGPTGTIRFTSGGSVREIDLASRKVTEVHPNGHDPAGDVWIGDQKGICGHDDQDKCVMVAGTDGTASIAFKACKSCELASLSPDGSMFAWAGYCREKACGQFSHATFVRDRHGKLIHVFPSLGSPVWTAGNQLVMAGDALQGRTGIYLAVDRVHEVRVDNGLADPIEISVSPDGKRVAFRMSTEGDGQAYTVPLAGGEAPKKITALQPNTAGWPAFSPDGKWIVFENKEKSWGDGVLSIVSADGGSIVALTDDAGKPVTANGRLEWR